MPPELLAVIGLLCAAGLFLLVPGMKALPDTVKLVTSGGEFARTFGILFLVFLLEILFFGVMFLALAWANYQGDPVGRMLAIVLCGTTATSLVFADSIREEGLWVFLSSLGATAVLMLSPNVRAFFDGRKSRFGDQPTPVIAARGIVVALVAILAPTGGALILLTTVGVKFLLIGACLVAASFAAYQANRRLVVADARARTVMTMLMAGWILALLLSGNTHNLWIPVGLAALVVVLLWVPAESQAFFGPSTLADFSASVTGVLQSWPVFNRPAAPYASTGGLAPGYPSTPMPPIPPPSSRSGYSSPSTHAPAWDSSAAVPPSPSFRALRAALSYGPWPEGSSPWSEPFGVSYDTRSWFPSLGSDETMRGRFLVTVNARLTSPNGGRADSGLGNDLASFRGRSTVLVSGARMVGVCAGGDSSIGKLDPTSGPVVIWDVAFDEVRILASVDPATGADRLEVRDRISARMMMVLTDVSILEGGGFEPSSVEELIAFLPRSAGTAPSPRQLAEETQTHFSLSEPPAVRIPTEIREFANAPARDRNAQFQLPQRFGGSFALMTSVVLALSATLLPALTSGGPGSFKPIWDLSILRGTITGWQAYQQYPQIGLHPPLIAVTIVCITAVFALAATFVAVMGESRNATLVAAICGLTACGAAVALPLLIDTGSTSATDFMGPGIWVTAVLGVVLLLSSIYSGQCLAQQSGSTRLSREDGP